MTKHLLVGVKRKLLIVMLDLLAIWFGHILIGNRCFTNLPYIWHFQKLFHVHVPLIFFSYGSFNPLPRVYMQGGLGRFKHPLKL